MGDIFCTKKANQHKRCFELKSKKNIRGFITKKTDFCCIFANCYQE